MSTTSRILFILGMTILSAANAGAQGLITEANNCYDAKNYECAVGKYKEALADKKYQEKDLATIQYRIGAGLSALKKYADAVYYLKEAIRNSPNWGSPVWELAYAYYEVDSFKLASDFYQKAAGFYTNDTGSLRRIHYWRGRSLSAQAYYDSAVIDYKKAYAIDSTSEYVNASMAAAYFDGRRYKESAKHYEKSIQYGEAAGISKKTMAARYYVYGRALNALARYDEAQAAFQKGLDLGYEVGAIYWAMAGNNYNQNKYREAVELYTKAISAYGTDTASQKTLYYWRGQAYEGQKDYNKALAEYDRSLNIDPRNKTSLNAKASLLIKQKKPKEAIAVYDNLLQLPGILGYDLSDYHYARGKAYLALKDSVRAKSDFLFSVEYDVYNAEANVELGNLAYAQKEWSKARSYYLDNVEEFFADSSELSRAYFQSGYANFSLGTSYTYTAKQNFLSSIRYDSLNKSAHRYLADVYYGEKDWTKAEAELTRCIRLYAKEKDSLAVMYKYRGMARAQQKKYPEALSDYEQSNKVVPLKIASDVKYMGQLAFELKDYEKGVQFFTKLIPLVPAAQTTELLYAYYARGRCYLEQKKKSNAVADLKKALEYDPNNQELKTWLTKAEALP